jgi:hypothetical protein
MGSVPISTPAFSLGCGGTQSTAAGCAATQTHNQLPRARRARVPAARKKLPSGSSAAAPKLNQGVDAPPPPPELRIGRNRNVDLQCSRANGQSPLAAPTARPRKPSPQQPHEQAFPGKDRYSGKKSSRCHGRQRAATLSQGVQCARGCSSSLRPTSSEVASCRGADGRILPIR